MSFHLYRIDELYSSADGSVQFIELGVGNFNGESHWQGVSIIATGLDGLVHTFVFNTDLPSTATANTTVLIATQGFADLGIVTPNYIVPSAFLFTNGGTLNFGNADSITYPPLPTDGIHSITRTGTQVTATPKNFAGVTGSLPAMPNLITGTDANNLLNGTAGMDRIDGLAGNDTVNGADGNDLLIGNDGNDNLSGVNGDDTLLGGAGADLLFGGAGDDTLDGGVVLDRYFSTDGNIAGYGAATSGVNIDLSGIGGDGSAGSGTATGDASVGTDTLINIALVSGSAFDDTIVGGTALTLEQFEGGPGDDTLDGGAITDTLNADNTNRLVYLNAAGAGVTVDLAAGTAVGVLGSNVGSDTLDNFNNVAGSRFDDNLMGSDRTDVPEYFQGGDGNDTIDGRGGHDEARYGNATGGITANLVTGLATGIAAGAGVGTDTLFNIESLRGSKFGDSLTGGNAANGVSVGDSLSESFTGNAGNDTIDGGQGYDIANYTTSTAAVNVVLNDSLDGSASDGFGDTDVLRSIEAVGGSIFNDTLVGSDTAALESFAGYEGNDGIDGLGGTDQVDYYLSRAGVVVDLTLGTASDGYGGEDSLFNIEDVRGSRDFNDLITGNSAANQVEGLGGKDRVYGGEGNDTIDGGAGTDTAVYSAARAGYSLVKTVDGFTLSDLTGPEGADTLLNMERLEFSGNTGIALDVGATQSGGGAQLLLGAVLGKDLLVSKKPLIGDVIDLFDQGYTLQQLSGAAMRLPIWDLLTGKAAPTNTDIATYLLTTVNKVAPDALTLNTAVTALDTELGLDQGDFLWHLVESAANQVQVGLIGLATTGLEFG